MPPAADLGRERVRAAEEALSRSLSRYRRLVQLCYRCTEIVTVVSRSEFRPRPDEERCVSEDGGGPFIMLS
jgi:hypothetical protein